MEFDLLSEKESKCYGDLFTRCLDSGKVVTVGKTTELLQSASNLNGDTVRQILQIAQVPEVANSSQQVLVSRKQFYVCLKLVAAHQASLPLRPDILASNSIINLPLPRFNRMETNSMNSSKQQASLNFLDQADGTSGPSCTEASKSGNSNSHEFGLGPPFVQRNSLTKISNSAMAKSPDLIELSQNPGPSDESQNVASSDQPSTDSEVEQNDDSSAVEGRKRRGSPGNWSTASESPTPTNSVAERPWVKGNSLLWQGLLCEEQRQLLGTEEESSDRHSSDEDNNENSGLDLESIYQITPEQREYYTKQFRTVQPDPKGLVSGQVARVFFEKSRIPIEELRHIWQLCDVTKDGALSLEEFAAAMHLVVLRRNNIQLPEKLPGCLFPDQIKGKPKNELPEADLLHLNDDDIDNSLKPEPKSMEEVLDSKEELATGPDSSTFYLPNVQQPQHLEEILSNQPDSVKWSSKPANATLPRDWNTAHSKEWTKFNESPTSSLASPVPKPANFDMQRTAQAVVSDPQILHPVPLRVTPIGSENPDQQQQQQRDNVSPKNQSQSHHHQNELRSIQRPQAKKLMPAKKNLGAIPPPPQRGDTANAMNLSMDSAAFLSTNNGGGADGEATTGKMDPPPIPPPRQPQHRHARSSSLDLNKLKLSNGQLPPPEIPPRVSPQMHAQLSCDAQMESVTAFADFTQFPESGEQVVVAKRPIVAARPMIPSQRVSAFEVYRKPTNSGTDFESKMAHLQEMLKQLNLSKSISVSQPGLQPQSTSNGGVLSTKEALQKLKEQNSALLNLCTDLTSELYAVQQKKEELRLRLKDGGVGGGGGGLPA